LVSIIIVNYKTKDFTKDCVRSILAKTEGVEFEISVVDNASGDGSAEELEEEFPGIRVIKNRTNGGFAWANNMAMRESRTDYFFILNPDTILVNNAVKIFCEFMEQEGNRNIACCGGSLYDEQMSPQIAFGNFPSLAEVAFKVFRLKKIFRKYYTEKLRASSEHVGESVRTVDYVVGADMFIRKSVLDKIGLFDEDFFLYFEDTELSYRMARNGYTSVILPDAKIIHLAGKASSHASRANRIRMREQSRFLFYRKCYGDAIALLVKTLYLLQYGQRFLFGFNKKNREMLKIIWRA
jgi:GT2 family glycosyltransferase